MKVLVTGGAGYVGCHVARALHEAGHGVVLLDDLSTGHERLAAGLPLVRASIHDRQALAAALRGDDGSGRVDAVAHLAGSALVPESVRKPELYWRNNVAGGLTVVEEMLEAGVPAMMFSSSCSVYGVPDAVPISEDAPTRPITPYGASKATFERILADVHAAHGLKSVTFRYFNAAGAHASGDVGEIHANETHLIPIVLDAIAGRRPKVVVHGTDHDTPDGTCIRDYVDVRDIARAHVLALEAMSAGRVERATYNLGHGRGHSVREVIRTCEEVTGRPVPAEDGARRPGDPPRLVADASRVARELGWRPEHDLRSIVEAAWRFASR